MKNMFMLLPSTIIISFNCKHWNENISSTNEMGMELFEEMYWMEWMNTWRELMNSFWWAGAESNWMNQWTQPKQSTNQPIFFSRSGRKKIWFVVAALAAGRRPLVRHSTHSAACRASYIQEFHSFIPLIPYFASFLPFSLNWVGCCWVCFLGRSHWRCHRP